MRKDKSKQNYKLSRKQYLEIKKLDHNQMEQKMQSIYMEGRNSLHTERIVEKVAAIPGIGPVKLDAIKEIIEECRGE